MKAIYLLNRNPLHPVERDLVASAVIELGRARTFMRGVPPIRRLLGQREDKRDTGEADGDLTPATVAPPKVQFEAELNNLYPWQEFVDPLGTHRLCSPNTPADVCNGPQRREPPLLRVPAWPAWTLAMILAALMGTATFIGTGKSTAFKRQKMREPR